jgi:hypothetical protein
MTAPILIIAALAATFVIGFLLGDRRAVRHCNTILDGHLQDLLKAMIEGDRPMPVDIEDERPTETVH